MNRKHEKEYQDYIKRIKSPKTVGGIFYPHGFGEPCSYKRWVKSQGIEHIALNKFNKVFK